MYQIFRLHLCPQAIIQSQPFFVHILYGKHISFFFLFIYQLVREHFTVEEIPEEQQDPVYHSPDIHLMKLKRKIGKALTNQSKRAVPSTNREQNQNQA